jgi:hypothetical protein
VKSVLNSDPELSIMDPSFTILEDKKPRSICFNEPPFDIANVATDYKSNNVFKILLKL